MDNNAVAVPVEQFDLNAHEEKQPEQFDLAPQSNQIYSVPEILKEKSEKFAFGVEAQPEEIKAQLETGGEHWLREAYAAQESLNKRQTRNNLILDIASKKKDPLTSDDLAEFDSLVNLDTNVDPKTVLEEAYGKKFSNLSFQTAKDVTVHKSTVDTVPDLALDGLDAVGSAIARREVATEVLQNLDLEFKRVSDNLSIENFFSSIPSPLNSDYQSEMDRRFKGSGSLLGDYVQMMLPGYATVKLGGWNLSTGDALKEEYQNLSLLSPSEFRTAFEARVQALAADNLPLALQWASGYLQYSNSDAWLDNAFGYADWAGVGALGVGVARRLKNIKGAVRPNVEVPPKAPEAVPEVIPTVSDKVRVTPVTSEEQLEHIKDFRKLMKDAVKAANAKTPEKSLETLGDVDAAAEMATHKRLVAEFNGKDPFDDGVDFRSKLQGVFFPHEFGSETGNLTAGQSAKIMGALHRSANNAVRMLSTDAAVTRMTPEQTAKAIEITKSNMLKEYSSVSDAILDVNNGGPFRVWSPEEQRVNVNTVELRLGELPAAPAKASTTDAPKVASVAPEAPSGPIDGIDGVVPPKDGGPLDRLAALAGEERAFNNYKEFRTELNKELDNLSAATAKHKDKDLAPWDPEDESFYADRSDAYVLKELARSGVIMEQDEIPNIATMIKLLQEGNKGKPVTEAQVQKILDFAKTKVKEEAVPAAPKTPPVSKDPVVNSVNKITAARKERVLVRDLYDEMKANGEWKKDFGEFRKYLNDLRKSGQIKMSAYTDNLPNQQEAVARNYTKGGQKTVTDDSTQVMKLTGERDRLEARIDRVKQTKSNYEKGLAQVKRELVAKGKTTSKGAVKRQEEIDELTRNIKELEAEKDGISKRITDLKKPAKNVKTSAASIEEGNWGSEFRRDIGHENTTLRNRVIDSEFVVKPRTKYTSPVRVHYVEPQSQAPSGASSKLPRVKAVYTPAVVENEEQLLTALVDLQTQIAKTPHTSLYDRITKYINALERRNIAAVDPGVDNRVFDTDMLGSPYSTKEFKSSAQTVEKRRVPRDKKAKQPGFSVVGRDESPLQLHTKDPDADFVGRDYSETSKPKPWQKRTSPDQVETYRDLEKQVNEYYAALSKNKKTPVAVKVGTPTASLFKTRAAAANYATNVYMIDPKRFRIAQQGNGYYISIPKIVDETYDAVRDLAIVNNKAVDSGREGWLKMALGTVITPDEYLSPLTTRNRKTAVYGPSEMHKYVEEMAPTLIGLRGSDREELTTILQAHRDYKYTETTASGREKVRRGKFSKTLGSFEQEFRNRFGKLPTEKQTTAYFEGVILHDADLGMRDLALVRDVGRLGLEKTVIGWHVPDPEVAGATQRRQSRPFAARPIDKLPLDVGDDEDWGVFVYDTHAKTGNFYLRSELNETIINDIDLKTSTHGYKILELGNPLEKPLIQAAKTDELVNFIVVKDYKAQKYDWSNIPRRPGGHINYQDNNFVKQPIIRRSERGGKTRDVYEGDEAILNTTTEAQAVKMAKAIDEGRLLLKDSRHADLKRHLEANTPWDYDQFTRFFRETVDPETGDVTPPRFSLDHPFTYTVGGRNTMDMSHFKDYSRQFPKFVDSIRSKYNLFANNVDKKYLGERHPDVPSVFEWKNKDDQPAFTLTAPRLIDPYESINSALANVSRSKYYNDLKIQAAENFIEQFHTVMEKPLDVMRRNPTYYLHNPGWDTTSENMPLILMGRHVRQAHLNMVGSETTLGKSISFTYEKMLNGIYEVRGQGKADKVSETFRNAKNPVDYVRGAVFNLKLGLFNPVQLFKQGVTVVNAAAISGSPARAWDSMPMAIASRWLDMTDDPKMIEGVADTFANLKGFNFNKSRFMEAYNELRATGFYNVGGEYATKDDLFDPKVAKGRAGEFLDKGTFFFKEGERFPRNLSWFMAYDEWRAANPKKAMTNDDRAWVLNRADTMTNNMSRASNANLQNGSFSVTTQFWSYSLRLAEQLLGTRLTAGERTRLILTNMAMWGVPVGLTGLTVVPFYDDIRQLALESGVDLKDPVIQVLHDGIVSAGLSVITGEEYSVGKAYGPGGIQALEKVLSGESGMLEFLGGAAGSVAGDMVKGSSHIYDYLMNWMDPEHTPPTAADLIDFTKNISSVSNAIRAYYMYQTGSYITNNDVEVLGDSSGTNYSTTGVDAFMQLAFGLAPTGVDNTYAMLKSNKERREAIAGAEKEARKQIKRAVEYEAQGDYVTGDIYRRKAKAALAPHVPKDRWPGVIREAMSDNVPLLEKVLEDFIKAAPDAETQKLRHERGYEMMGVQE